MNIIKTVKISVVSVLSVVLLFGNVSSAFASPLGSNGVRNNRNVQIANATNTLAKKNYTAKTYYEHLAALEKKDKNLEKNVRTTIDMNQASNESYNMWDYELNFLYQKLKAKLSTANFKKLQQEQRKWITYKEKEMKKVEKDWWGGTGATSAINATASELTKKRVYVLAEKMYGKKPSTVMSVVKGSYWQGTSSPSFAKYYIKISNCTSKGFDFEIFGRQKVDENFSTADANFSTVFKHHTAVYTSSKTATYNGQKYTLNFSWKKKGYLSVDGFPEWIPNSDILYNSDYIGVS